MIINIYVLSLVIIYVIIVIYTATILCPSSTQKLFFISTVLGFSIYNGFAVSSAQAPNYMIYAFFIFIIVLFIGFRFGAILTFRLGNTITYNSRDLLMEFAEGALAKRMIVIYFTLILVTLMVPIFKLHLLFAPPSPDLLTHFNERFTTTRSVAESILMLLITLMTPLYYLALYRYREATAKLCLLIMIPLYIFYVRDAYIGRYEILFALLYLFIMSWKYRPEWRTSILIITVALLPILGSFAQAYISIRVGETYDISNVSMNLRTLFEKEVMLPMFVGVPLVESNENADLTGYFTWLFTLPIPGFMKGMLPITYLNYDISETVLDKTRGTNQFFVVLPGLIAESIYLYGRKLYILHPFMIGLISGAYAGLLQNIPRIQGVTFYLSILMFFNLNRGGIASFLPPLLNGFLLLAAIVIFTVVHKQRKRAILV